MIKRYINLIMYILILLTIVIIISRGDIIERYVDITKFGEFVECDNTCEDGRELKGCGGLDMGSCEPCRAGTAGTGGECNIRCTGNKYSLEGADKCSQCNNGEQVDEGRTGCEPCPAGTAGTGGECNIRCTGNKYSTGGTTSCSTCDMDMYSVNSNNTACQECPVGSDGKGGYCNNVSQIVCGGYHTIFLTSYGKVYGCGLNNIHQINSSYFDEITRPTEITDIPTGETIDQIACGGLHTMFLTSYGNYKKVYGRGHNYYNQVSSNTGSGLIKYLTEITDFSPELGNGEIITQIVCGKYYTMFLTSFGNVYGCGMNDTKQINSDDDTINSPTQVTILPIGSTDEIIQIACGHYHTMFLTKYGNVYGRGWNFSKQINSDGGIINSPTQVTILPIGSTDEIIQIACGRNYTMYLTKSGKVYRIGNYSNQPTEITNFPEGEKIDKIACGESHTIFLTKSEKVYGIGNNDKNQINSNGGFIAQPTEITDFNPPLGYGETITEIACGGEHTMFLTSYGNYKKVYGCGKNISKNKELIIL